MGWCQRQGVPIKGSSGEGGEVGAGAPEADLLSFAVPSFSCGVGLRLSGFSFDVGAAAAACDGDGGRDDGGDGRDDDDHDDAEDGNDGSDDEGGDADGDSGRDR